MTANATVFAGLNICLVHNGRKTFDKDISEIQNVIQSNNGTVLQGLKKSQQCTHIVTSPNAISALRKNALDILQSDGHGPKIVTENWIYDSVSQGRLMDEQLYKVDIPKEELAPKRSKRIQERSQKGTSRSNDDQYDYDIAMISSDEEEENDENNDNDDDDDDEVQFIEYIKSSPEKRKREEEGSSGKSRGRPKKISTSPPPAKRGRGRPKKDPNASPSTPPKNTIPPQQQPMMFNFVSYAPQQPQTFHRFPPLPPSMPQQQLTLPPIMSPSQMQQLPPPPLHQIVPPPPHLQMHMMSNYASSMTNQYRLDFKPPNVFTSPPQEHTQQSQLATLGMMLQQIPHHAPPPLTPPKEKRKYQYTWTAEEVVKWIFENVDIDPVEARAFEEFLTKERFGGDVFSYEIDEQLLKDAGFSSNTIDNTMKLVSSVRRGKLII
jgi:hypothetical protein